ncbi:MAG: hypothetical protein JNJ46_28960 [Myxococcales bacterium]|nr:hypothetical protein [Myxococcales bacterium]
MESFKPEGHERRQATCEGWTINVTSYRLRDRYYCKIDNNDPGATISRGQGETREAAEEEALRKATSRLALTRRIQSTREVLSTMQQSVERLSSELAELERISQQAGQSDPELPSIPRND